MPPKSTSATKQIREAGAAVHACAHLILGERTAKKYYGNKRWNSYYLSGVLVSSTDGKTKPNDRAKWTLNVNFDIVETVHSESLYVECHEIWTKIFHRLDNHPVCVKVRWQSNGWMYMVVYWLTTLWILNHHHIRPIMWFQCYQTLIYAEKLSPKVTYLLRTVHCGHMTTFTQPCHLRWCGMIHWRWQIYIWLIERKYQIHDWELTHADDEHDLKEALTTLCKEVGSLIRILPFTIGEVCVICRSSC